MDRRHGFMLLAPSPSQNVLAEILAETATVDGGRLARMDSAALVHRGYCRHCVDTLGSND